MAEPFIYIGTMTIKPGKLEEARKRIAELVDSSRPTNHA